MPCPYFRKCSGGAFARWAAAKAFDLDLWPNAAAQIGYMFALVQ
jgi:hypothetical protein